MILSLCIAVLVFTSGQQQGITTQSTNAAQQKTPAAAKQPQANSGPPVTSSPVSETTGPPPNAGEKTHVGDENEARHANAPTETDWIQVAISIALLLVIFGQLIVVAPQACIYTHQRKILNLPFRV